MKRFWSVLVLAAIGLACFLAAELRAQQNEQELRALVPKIVASWETMDFAKIEPYYAADADLTYFDLAPPEVQQLGRISRRRAEGPVRTKQQHQGQNE